MKLRDVEEVRARRHRGAGRHRGGQDRGHHLQQERSPGACRRITVDEPTVSMNFTINTSPFGGQDGTYVQSSRIHERLLKEARSNVAIQVERGRRPRQHRGQRPGRIPARHPHRDHAAGRLRVLRGPARSHLSIRKRHRKLEPIERLLVDCEERFLGVVTEKLSLRKGKMLNLVNNGKGRVRIEFSVPGRSLIGYRDEFLTDTRGTGIMHSLFDGYEEFRGECPSRFTGSIVADRTGKRRGLCPVTTWSPGAASSWCRATRSTRA